MKKMTLLLGMIFASVIFLPAQDNLLYDSALAKKNGADDYGMKQYVLAFLKTGKNIPGEKAKQELLKGHMANIGKLAAEGKLVLAGPMMDDTGLEGVFIFNVKTVAEAELLSNTDPAVKAGMFSMEYHPWYATAALMEVVTLHKRMGRKKIG